jgi:hypothetical protein
VLEHRALLLQMESCGLELLLLLPQLVHTLAGGNSASTIAPCPAAGCGGVSFPPWGTLLLALTMCPSGVASR